MGGNAVFVNSTELRLPAPMLPFVGDSVSFVLFHDMGNVLPTRVGSVWSFDAGAAVIAPPISYSVGGRQYVTVLSGNDTSGSAFAVLYQQYGIDYRSQKRRVLTFALNSNTAHSRGNPNDAVDRRHERGLSRGRSRLEARRETYESLLRRLSRRWSRRGWSCSRSTQLLRADRRCPFQIHRTRRIVGVGRNAALRRIHR